MSAFVIRTSSYGASYGLTVYVGCSTSIALRTKACIEADIHTRKCSTVFTLFVNIYLNVLMPW